MKRPWMPLYVGDFIADTMHLSATETGIYIRLIMHCWMHEGRIPTDDGQLARISHCDSRLWRQYKTKVLGFFCAVDASTMQHRRVSTELLRCEEISNKRKASAKQMLSKRQANAEQLLTQSQSQSQRKKESNGIINLKDKEAFSAYPESPRFKSWKTYFVDTSNKQMVKELTQRELEGRPFIFAAAWPPG